jgi:prophage regulatory protein
MRILRQREVIARTGLSAMTLWRREHQNPPTFPRRIKLGPNAVGWLESEIDDFIKQRIAERDGVADNAPPFKAMPPEGPAP